MELTPQGQLGRAPVLASSLHPLQRQVQRWWAAALNHPPIIAQVPFDSQTDWGFLINDLPL